MKKILHIMVAAAFLCSAHFTTAQDTKIRFFGQPEFRSSNTNEKNMFKGVDGTGQYILKDSSYSSSNFNTGNFVLFVTSQLSERISVLSEVSFNNTGNEFNFEIQRLMLKYYVKDYFSIRVGKMFTPIGYWNNQYTFGLVLQPTIQRPFAIRAAGDGGVIQTRDAGLQLEGDNIGKARFFYRAFVGNGIGYYGSNDKGDSHIGVTIQAGAEPIEGFKVSASVMFDRIEEGKPNPNGTIAALPDDGRVKLYVGSVAYMNPEKKAEFIGELVVNSSEFDEAGDFISHSYYGYAGYKITDKITPYVLYNHSQAGNGTSEGDPYFSPIPVTLDVFTLGARYKFNSSFITKLEYEFNKTNLHYPDVMSGTVKLDDGFVSSTEASSVRLQFAFVF